MPKKTYTQINSITLAAASSSVTFGSIPQNFRDLVLVINGTATTNVTLKCRFNGDSGSNYTAVGANGTGSATQSATTGTITELNLTISNAFGTTISTIITQIMDYSATDKHKTTLTRNNVTASSFPGAEMSAGRYASTSALTSILIFPSTGSLGAGSRLDLYGIAS